ncbi:hypothetical protein WJX77_002073 [Trebouxia sp. C0004]
MEALFAVFSVLLAASYSLAAGVNQTGVTSSQLDVVASQPQTISCAAPAPLGKYDKYCEGLQAEYFLLPKQKVAPSLTNLKPNITSFVTSLNDTAAAMSLKGVNQLVAAKTHSFAVRYTGVLFVDQKGAYQFSLNSPAGTRLTVNGNTLTFNEGSNSSTPTTGYNFATAGYIPVEMVFFNENTVPSLTAMWQGPSSTIFTVLEGNSIMFNCTSIQNMTNSVPATSSGLCSGLSAVYYSDWAKSTYASATDVATFAVYEPGLNHWSTTTTPSWSGLPQTLSTDFAARYHGQLWVPIAGTYTFKLYADTTARLFVGTQNILNATANAANVAISQSVSYTFATPGYVPVGLNFISRKSSEAGVLRLVWKGPNSPVFGVTTPFSHPCSTFVACANSTTAGALPQEVVGAPPAGSTIESVTAISSSSLATYVPNSNVTFTLGFPSLTAEDPNVEDVAYFVREAVANAAGLKLESVWTVPSIDSTTGQVVFPLGAYFTTLAGAKKFYNLVNLRPQTIFSGSGGLSDFYPITVSSPALGTTVATPVAVQPARSMATLDSATGEDDMVPLPPVPSPTPAASPVMANTTAVAASPSPSPTVAAPAEAPATPEPAAPEASLQSPSSSPTTVSATPTPAAPAPVVPETPAATPSSTPTEAVPAPAPVVPETPSATPSSTPTEAAPAPAPVEPETPAATPSSTPTEAAPAPAPVVPETPAATPSSTPTEAAPAPAPVVPETPAAIPSSTPTEAAPAPAPVVPETPAAIPSSTPTEAAPAPAPVVPETPAATPSPVPAQTVTPAVPAPAPVAAGSPSPTAITVKPITHNGSPAVATGPAAAPMMATTAPMSGTLTGPPMYGSPSPTAAAPVSGPSASPAVVAPAPAPSTISVSAPSPTTTSSSSLPSPYTPSPILAPVSAPLASPLVYAPHSHPLIPAPATAPATGPTTAYPLPSAPPPPSPPILPTPGVAAPGLLPPSKTPTAAPSVPRALLPADALPVYAPVVVPGSYAVDGVFVPGPPVAAPSNGGSYFVPYTGNAGGYQVPFPPLTSPTSAPGYGAAPSGTLFGAPGSVPAAMGPALGPSVGVPRSAPGPYGSLVASPYAGKTYFVPYPEGVGGYMVPYPAGYGSSTPSRNLGGVSGPSMAPSSPAWNLVFGNGPTTISPNDNKDLLVYYGLPITCKPGSASCIPGPYAYYAPGGTQKLTPGNEAQLLNQSPASSLFGSAPGPAPEPAPGSVKALTPAAFLPIAQGPAAAAPAASALCACSPKDTTPRSVKIEVLSTAYNSTTSDTIKFNAYLTFTHPTKSLNSSQVRVFTRQPTDGSGTVTTPGVITLLQPISQNCAFYSLKGYVTESNPFIVNSTDIYLAAGGDILDACGHPFNVTVTQVQQTHRLEGLLYATGVAYSEAAGVLLDSNVLDLALAFTDSVPLLNASMFTVTGPPNMSTTELQTVDSSDAYYTFSVTVPDNYYGSITVAMDQAGQDYLTSINSAAVAPAALTISRVDPVQQGNLVNSTMTKAGRGL